MRRLLTSVLLALGSIALCTIAPGPAVADRTPAAAERTTRLDYSALGTTHSLNRVLRTGCHGYVYSYHIRPTTTEWTLEIFLSDPRHHQIASNFFISNADEINQTSRFKLCKPTTRTGRFVIRGLLTMKDGTTSTEGYIKTSTFRLCKAPKPYHRHPCDRAASGHRVS